MRVLCVLDELMEDLGITDAGLARQLNVDERTIKKLREDTDPWRLPRETLHKLMLFAHDHDYPSGLFEIQPHPIWRNFEAREVAVLRGSASWDARVEGHLSDFFGKLGSTNNPLMDVDDVDQVSDLMKTRSCVIIGSPKSNPASEIAFSLLWGAKPFDSDESNAKRVPIHFLGMQAGKQRESALLRQSATRGLSIQVPTRSTRSLLQVSWRPPDSYRSYAGEGIDAGVLVVCNQPLGAKEPNTTILVAGYTGRASLLAAKQATHHEIPITDRDLNDLGKPHFGILKYLYTKRRTRGNKLGGLRKELSNSLTWGPPWPRVLG